MTMILNDIFVEKKSFISVITSFSHLVVWRCLVKFLKHNSSLPSSTLYFLCGLLTDVSNCCFRLPNQVAIAKALNDPVSDLGTVSLFNGFYLVIIPSTIFVYLKSKIFSISHPFNVFCIKYYRDSGIPSELC